MYLSVTKIIWCSQNDQVTLSIPPGVITDLAGNNNTGVISQSVTYDPLPLTATLSTSPMVVNKVFFKNLASLLNCGCILCILFLVKL